MMTNSEPSLTNVLGKLSTPEAFSKHIQFYSTRNSVTCIDTILAICEDKGLDPSLIVDLITPKLRDLLAKEAKDLNIRPGTLTQEPASLEFE